MQYIAFAIYRDTKRSALNLIISATKKEKAKLWPSLPLDAGDHHGICFGELDLILSFSQGGQ